MASTEPRRTVAPHEDDLSLIEQGMLGIALRAYQSKLEKNRESLIRKFGDEARLGKLDGQLATIKDLVKRYKFR